MRVRKDSWHESRFSINFGTIRQTDRRSLIHTNSCFSLFLYISFECIKNHVKIEKFYDDVIIKNWDAVNKGQIHCFCTINKNHPTNFVQFHNNCSHTSHNVYVGAAWEWETVGSIKSFESKISNDLFVDVDPEASLELSSSDELFTTWSVLSASTACSLFSAEVAGTTEGSFSSPDFDFLPPFFSLTGFSSFDSCSAPWYSWVYKGQKEAKNPTSSVKLGNIQKWCFPNVNAHTITKKT